MELETRIDDHEEPFVSHNFVKSAVIGAILGGLGFLLYRTFRSQLPSSLFHHTIPPIIIRYDEASEPIEIETQNVLQETEAMSIQGGSSLLGRKLYTMSGFDRTRYVGVYRHFTQPGHLTRYKKNSGLEVKMWLQYKDGGEWYDEPDGPHLIVEGTASRFRLTCDQLSDDHLNPGNSHRPRKRSFNKSKKWRIWQVQVDSNPPVTLDDYRKMEIRFDDTPH